MLATQSGSKDTRNINLRNIGTQILTFVTGMVVSSSLLVAILGIILLVTSIAVDYVKFVTPNTLLVYDYISYIMMIVGGSFAIYSRAKKNRPFQIWRISKSNLKLNLWVAVISTLAYRLSRFILLVIFGLGVPSEILIVFSISIVSDFIIFYLMGYPFSALLSYGYRNLRASKFRILLLISVFLMNPIFIQYFSSINYSLLSPLPYGGNCGVIITHLQDNSPLFGKDVIHKPISSVNGIRVEHVEDITEALETTDTTDEIEILINSRSIYVTPIYDPILRINSLGITVTEVPCRDERNRWIRDIVKATLFT